MENPLVLRAQKSLQKAIFLKKISGEQNPAIFLEKIAFYNDYWALKASEFFNADMRLVLNDFKIQKSTESSDIASLVIPWTDDFVGGKNLTPLSDLNDIK